MTDWLTAGKVHDEGLHFSETEGGRTLTSVPVSARKRVPLAYSVI